MNTSTKKNQKNADKITLSKSLGTISVTEAIEELRRLHHRFALFPAATEDQVLARLARLADLAGDKLTVLDIASRAGHYLSIATGVPRSEITRAHATELAEELHITRNLMVAAAAAGAGLIRVDSVEASPEAVYSNAIRLARRSTTLRRPFADDEIVLCRTAALLAARKDRRNHAATIYTLLDVGFVPGETTRFQIDDVDDPELPTQVLAAGNKHLTARFIEVDRFGRHILTWHINNALRAGHRPDVPLTYKGRKNEPGSPSAVASAQRIIDRFIDQLRLPTGDITASSITLWRVATVLGRDGEDAAVAVSGRHGRDLMYRALGQFLPPSKDIAPDDGLSFAAAV